MDNGASSYRRFLDGDDAGIAEIVSIYKDGLIFYLRSLAPDIHTAEDLAEDTFFRLMIKKPKFSGRSSFKSWLYAIGRHIAVDWLRHHARQVPVPDEVLQAQLADETNLEQRYLQQERRILVHHVLQKLPPDYRQVLWLIYFEALSHTEACAVMNRSARQMRNLLYRAKQAMKTELEQEGFDDEDFR